MTNNEEQELRNAAKYLRQFPHPIQGTVRVAAIQWASMLERAADRIQELEAHLERFVA